MIDEHYFYLLNKNIAITLCSNKCGMTDCIYTVIWVGYSPLRQQVAAITHFPPNPLFSCRRQWGYSPSVPLAVGRFHTHQYPYPARQGRPPWFQFAGSGVWQLVTRRVPWQPHTHSLTSTPVGRWVSCVMRAGCVVFVRCASVCDPPVRGGT